MTKTNMNNLPPIREINYLEGPQSRFKEFLFTIKVAAQFIKGFRVLHFVGPCITIFGSARFKEDHEYYQAARRIGAHIAQLGFTVMTGGGPGIMEAANKGGFESKNCESIGLNINLPHEQSGNKYTTKHLTFDYFFVRKVMLIKYSLAYVIFRWPGFLPKIPLVCSPW